MGSTASGLVAGLNAAQLITDKSLIVFPLITMRSSLGKWERCALIVLKL